MLTSARVSIVFFNKQKLLTYAQITNRIPPATPDVRYSFPNVGRSHVRTCTYWSQTLFKRTIVSKPAYQSLNQYNVDAFVTTSFINFYSSAKIKNAL